MSGITSTGLGSGLDIKSLVSSLVAAEKTPATTRLDTEEAELTTQVSSYGSLKSAMSTFQSSLSGLNNASSFQQVAATSSDTSIISASAFSNADMASYNMEVKQLAKSQTLATGALPSTTSTMGTGTLTIKFGTTTFDPVTKAYTGFTQDGSKGSLTLNVDSTNNTLTGLSEAINKANAGVTASIITDNSGSRLVLNSTATGANSSMEISVADTGDGNNTDALGLSALAFNSLATNVTQYQTAQDAKLAINGLDIVSSSNTVNTALKGLSLNLLQAQPGKIVTVGTSQKNDDITKAVNDFVKGFNDLIAVVEPLVSYDPKTQAAGPLLGDPTLTSAMWKLRAELGNMVKGLNGSATSLADIGISTQKDGTLALDSAKLNSQLASNRTGVAGVFAAIGRPSNSNMVFLSNTADTTAGQYAIDITQAATQGVLNNGTVPSSLTVGPGIDTFAIKVNGTQSGTIALTQKTYASYTEVAAEMQSRINGDSAIKASGASIIVTYDATPGSEHMVFTSKTYGASSLVELTANTTTLGLNIGAGTAGKDIGGTIGGLAATGTGQTLTSTAGASLGLSLIIGDNTVGTKGTVDFSRGTMEQLDKILNGILDSTTGSLYYRTTGLQQSLDNITAERAQLATRMDELQTSLYARFNLMDAMMGRMQSIGNYLQQQFNPPSKG